MNIRNIMKPVLMSFGLMLGMLGMMNTASAYPYHHRHWVPHHHYYHHHYRHPYHR